jgi:hypothetical protein
MGDEVARAKYTLIRTTADEAGNILTYKEFKVLKFNKAAQTVKLRGDLCDFETSLEKAISSGYKLIKDAKQ